MRKTVILTLCSFLLIMGCKEQSNVRSISYKDTKQLVAEAQKQIMEISIDDFFQLMNGESPYVLLDLRLPEEHNKGYIPGSVCIPRGVLEFRIGSEKVWDEEGLYVPEKDEKLILYCKMSNRSPLAALRLQQLGYQNVHVLNGGWKAWKQKYPEVKEDNMEEGAGEYAAVEEEDSGGC